MIYKSQTCFLDIPFTLNNYDKAIENLCNVYWFDLNTL